MEIPNFKTMTLAEKMELLGSLLASRFKTFSIHPKIASDKPRHELDQKDGNPEAKCDGWCILAPVNGCGWPAEIFPTFEAAIDWGIFCAIREHNAEYHERTKKTRRWSVSFDYRSKTWTGGATFGVEALNRRHAINLGRALLLKDKRRRITYQRLVGAEQVEFRRGEQ